MNISAADVKIILAALRYTCTAFEEIAKIQQEKGDRLAAFRSGAFGARCGELSNELERQATGRIIRPQ